jgi:hypothetical protein
MKKVRIFLVIIMFMGVLAVMAQSSETPGVDRRQRHQRARIREGVGSGRKRLCQEGISARFAGLSDAQKQMVK